jgi:hypothetical protein
MSLSPGTKLGSYEIVCPSARAEWAKCTALAIRVSAAKSL